MFAGRSEAINGKRKINQLVQCLDIKSMYPSVVGGCDDELWILGFETYFPHGECIKVERQNKNKFGFYNCIIQQQGTDKDFNVIPNRIDKKPLDWKYKGVIKTVLGTTDIEVLRKAFGDDIVEVNDGYEFESKIHSWELFPHMELFKQIKQEQDEFKDTNNPKYNVALWETAKLFLNSFTGKLLEKSHEDEVWFLYDGLSWEKAHSELDITFYEKIGDVDVVHGKIKDYSKYSPVHLGV